MNLATWRSPLARALHLNRSLVYARYFQLATIAGDGYPANRTVVFRGFLGETNQIKIITDSRSQKAHQVQDHPQGEICWYFPKSREQFRFRGNLILVTGDDLQLQLERRQMWQDISPAARSQFFWASPGEPPEMIDQVTDQANQVTDQVEIEQLETERLEIEPLDEDATRGSNTDPNDIAANFCLLLFNPLQVDHLELRGNPQNRYSHTWDGNHWTAIAINP
jgi:pyridoxamine 5'-phosphate oxidase